MEQFSPSQVIVLIACRVAPLFLGATISPLSKLPGFVRVVIVLILSLGIYLGLQTPVTASNALPVAVVAELTIGCCFALIIYGAFIATQFWGRVVDMQMGFGAAGVMVPSSKTMESITGTVVALGLTTFFFITGGHALLLQVLVKSIDIFPLGQFSAWLLPSVLAKFWGSVFLTAMMLFAPVMVLLWCIDCMVGIVSKTMPQVNIYFVTLPLKIALGMFAFAMMLPMGLSVFERLMAQMFEQLT